MVKIDQKTSEIFLLERVSAYEMFYVCKSQFDSTRVLQKSSVTNRLRKFYPRYILKCFTALEWCVE